MLRCERCKAEIHFLEKCDSCGRSICRACVKSSRRPQKMIRIVICKDCWSDMKKRSQYKSQGSGRQERRREE